MKAVKIIVGTVFGLLAVRYLFWFFVDVVAFIEECRRAGFSRDAFFQLAGGIAPLCISSGIAIWAFRSAFRNATKSQHRWYQFTLRTLALYAPLVTVLISWSIVAEYKLMQRDAIKREIVKAVLDSGGDVPGWQRDGARPVCRITIHSDAGLKYVTTRPHFGEFEVDLVVLDGPQVTDSSLEYLKPWDQIRFLCLKNTRITSQGTRNFQDAKPTCEINRGQ